MPHAAALPFILVLLGLAAIPTASAAWWEHQRNKALFSAAFAVPTAAFLALRAPALLQSAAEDYLSFILLLGSLFIIAGGIVVRGRVGVGPLGNAALLLIGALLASVIGTTGAAMLMIRPFLRANVARRHARHLTIFFIFIVANTGGLLTPLGDPPLFLGFLHGVPFGWPATLLPQWLLTNAVLLAAFVAFDVRAGRGEVARDPQPRSRVSVHGLHNVGLLASVAAAALLLPAVYREFAIVSATVLSWIATPRALRVENDFTLAPITEVAIIFAAIFVTMAPALALLAGHAAALDLRGARSFFWASGLLSSFLDNAPTYMSFFALAQAQAQGGPGVGATGIPEATLAAISLGSVLMGANTYLGNGPNLMVKAIAEECGFAVPSFIGYLAWSVPLCVPVWLLIGWLFL